MISRLRTGWSSSDAARTQPVRPFGRPGTLIRYQVGLPVFFALTTSRARTYCGRKSGRNSFRTVTRFASALGFASTATWRHAIVPDPTTSTSESFVEPAPAPGARARASATSSTAPAAAADHRSIGIAFVIPVLRVSPAGGRGNSSFEGAGLQGSGFSQTPDFQGASEGSGSAPFGVRLEP